MMPPTTSSLLRLDYRIDPPRGVPTNDFSEVGVLCTMKGMGLDAQPILSLDMAIVPVGGENRRDDERLARVMGQMIESAPAHERLLIQGGFETADADRVSTIIKCRQSDLGTALLDGARTLEEQGRVDASARLLLWVGPGMILSTEPLLQAIDLLGELKAGVEVICTDSAADMRLLTQICNLAGGEFIHDDSYGGLEKTFARRLGILRNQRVASVRLRLQFQHQVKPVCFFRVQPSPLVVRELRLNEHEEYADIDLGPMSGESDLPQYLITALIPRRPKGDLPLVKMSLMALDADVNWSMEVNQPAAPQTQTHWVVDGVVSSARERVEASLIIEEMAHAYTREDGGRIAMLLDNLVRYYTILGRDAVVEELAMMKLEFLRGGLWGRANLNTIRRLASQNPGPDWR